MENLTPIQKVLEVVETMKDDAKINEGEYLDLMNGLKKLNAAIHPQPAFATFRSTIAPREHEANPNILLALREKYLKDEYAEVPEGFALLDEVYKAIKENRDVDYGYIYCVIGIDPFNWVIDNQNLMKDEIRDDILFSKHVFSKSVLGLILRQAIGWKHWYINGGIHEKKVPIKKTDETTSKKGYVVRVDILSPIQESFNMETKLIRLGASSTIVSNLKHYIFKQMDIVSFNKKTIDYIKNSSASLHLTNSGITGQDIKHKQNRKYVYDDNFLRYNITYFPKDTK